ncbi:class I SAM-dependent methyltransferase [Nocardia rhamnosiphila]
MDQHIADPGDNAPPRPSAAARDAAAPYTRPFLAAYDLWVIRLSNPFAWQCPSQTMLDLYNQHTGPRHLEIGPGSGWYLAHTDLPPGTSITLMDLNPTPMSYTQHRMETAGHHVHTVTGNVLDPVPADAGTGFDSIGMNFVMHCVPGTSAEKSVAFQHLAHVLADDGTLFGSTILNTRPRTVFGRALSFAYSRVGAFNNSADDRPALENSLRAAFRQFAIAQVGDVTLFTARGPRR